MDFSIQCPSIFERKRPLAENTMKRIARGIKRYVIDNPDPFIIQTGYGERPGQLPRVPDINKPLGTVVAGGVKHALITPFITEHANASNQRNMPADEPLRTQCAQVKGGHFAVVSPYIIKHFGGATGSDARQPLPTILARNTQNQLLAVNMLREMGQSVGQVVDKPAPTVMPGGLGKTRLVTSHIAKLRGTNTGSKTDEPLHTISAQGLHHAEVCAFLIKYYGNDKSGCNIKEPIHTITAKQRFGIVTVHGEQYKIVDIGMRMLQPRELYRAHGFPDSYIIDPEFNGKPMTKTNQVRMCGNSVCPPVAEAIVRANVGVELKQRVQA